MVRKTIVTVILMAIFLTAGLQVRKWLVDNKVEPARSHVAASAPLVDTVTLTPEDTREILYGYGSARADREATLSAEVSAPVIELVDELNEGVAVAKDQVLVRLDERQYRLALHEAESMIQAREAELAQLNIESRNLVSLLEIAESDLNLNRIEMDRVRGLYDEGHAPKKEFDDARLRYQGSLRIKQSLDNEIALQEPRRLKVSADLRAAQARVEHAELDIERCAITAPFAGSVASLSVEVGDKVRIGDPVLTLVNLERIEIPIALPIAKRASTSIDAAVRVQLESLPESGWSGTVARIAPLADERSRTFQVYVEVDNRTQATPLLPGCFVKADIDGPVIPAALVVPRRAIVGGNVFVANDHKAHKRSVRILRLLGDQAVLAGEIHAGDELITTNLDMLYDGAPVRLAGEKPITSAESASEEDTP